MLNYNYFIPQQPPSVGRSKIILFHAWFYHKIILAKPRQCAELVAQALLRERKFPTFVCRRRSASAWRLRYTNAAIGCNTASWIFMLKLFMSFQTWFHVKIKFFKIILDVLPWWNKIILGRSTDGGGSGIKFFKIILFWHGTTALDTLFASYMCLHTDTIQDSTKSKLDFLPLGDEKVTVYSFTPPCCSIDFRT